MYDERLEKEGKPLSNNRPLAVNVKRVVSWPKLKRAGMYWKKVTVKFWVVPYKERFDLAVINSAKQWAESLLEILMLIVMLAAWPFAPIWAIFVIIRNWKKIKAS